MADFNYDEINSAILNAINRDIRKATPILDDALKTVEQWPMDRSQHRVIDGQLQKLKRSGKIEFAKGNWSLVKA